MVQMSLKTISTLLISSLTMTLSSYTTPLIVVKDFSLVPVSKNDVSHLHIELEVKKSDKYSVYATFFSDTYKNFNILSDKNYKYTQFNSEVIAKEPLVGNYYQIELDIEFIYAKINSVVANPIFHFQLMQAGIPYTSLTTMIYPMESKTIKISNNQTYETRKYYYYQQNGAIMRGGDEFTFTGIKNTYYALEGIFIDISNIILKHEYDYPKTTNPLLPLARGVLYFNDFDNMFPNLKKFYPYPLMKYVEVELSYRNRQNTTDLYYLSLVNTYYHPVTHNLSEKKLSGYERTEKLFYFPINNNDNLAALSFNLELYDVGVNRYTFTHKFNVISDYQTFGDCSNSNFCQVVEQSTNSEDVEDVIEVVYT